MKETLEDLKNRIHDLPLSEVLEKYISLHRVGKQTKAVCPFHDDHNPSLQINDDKGFWYCFVDQMGGDAIKFVQYYKKVEFKEALEDICDALGWNFQNYNTQKKGHPKYEMGKKILAKAAQIYKKVAESEQAEPFNQFLQQRRLSDTTAQTYALGFAPAKNTLTKYLQSLSNSQERDLALQIALELGIIKKNKNNHKNANAYYDQFRERVMFPICNDFGQIIGFTSRACQPHQKPKYLNSIDSFLFKKHELLYGLHLAKKAIRDHHYVILVEGNMDQIALHQAGFLNTIAIMGTGFRESSAQKILALTQKIYLCFDSDQGGQVASARVSPIFMKQGVIPLFIDLSPHKDPDEFILALGSLEFQKRIDEAKSFVDIQLTRAFPGEVPEIPERKLDILQSFFEILAPLKMTLSATERIIPLAKQLGLQTDSKAVIDLYEKYLKNQKTPNTSPDLDPLAPEESSPKPSRSHKSQEETSEILLNRLEKILLPTLIQHPQLLSHRELPQWLDFVQSNEVKTYLLELRELMYEIDQAEYQNTVHRLGEDGRYSLSLTSLINSGLERYQNQILDEKAQKKMAQDLKQKLEEEKLKAKKQEIKEQQKMVQTEEENQKLLNELFIIQRQLAQLKNKRRINVND